MARAKKVSTPAGFEPARGDPKAFRVLRLRPLGHGVLLDSQKIRAQNLQGKSSRARTYLVTSGKQRLVRQEFHKYDLSDELGNYVHGRVLGTQHEASVNVVFFDCLGS